MPQRQAAQLIDRVVSEAASLIPSYIRDNQDFEEVGGRKLETWRDGLDQCSKSYPRVPGLEI